MSSRTSLAILLAVTLAGAGTMTVELAAVRLLAPWFGTTAAVWTNVIGVVLLALAVGYLAGARLSTGGCAVRRMGVALLGSGLLTGALPFLAAPLAQLFRPDGIALDQAGEVLLVGSLATSFVLFFPAAAALGCVGPLAVQVVQEERGGSAGDAGGRVLAASTLGSLVGTFATTHFLVPRLGLTWTFLLAGGVLLLLGVLLVRRWGPAALAVLAIGGAAVAPAGGLPEPGPGMVVLDERQSPYQALRVVETQVDGRPFRLLQVNEGLDSFQSVWQPEVGLLPQGHYYNLFALPPWWGEGTEAWRLCVLGLGAGTTWRVLEGTLPPGVEVTSTGVELDPEVVALGRRWFDLPENGERYRVLAGWDARVALEELTGSFDQIVLDAYANQVEIPPHLSTVEFFRRVHAALLDGGWLVVNVGGFGLGDPVVLAVAETVAAAFEQRTLVVRVPFSRNCVLFARRGAQPPEPGDTTWERAERGPLRALLPAMELPGAWRWVEPGGAALTDDRNPIEALQRQSIRAAREEWG